MVMPLEHVIHCACNISSYCQIFAVIYAANLLSTREFINLPLSGVWVKLIYTTQQHKSQDLRGFYNLHSVQHPWFEWENTFPPKLPVELGTDQTIPCRPDQPDVLHCVRLTVIWSISPLPSHQKGRGKRLEPGNLIRSYRFLHSFIISCIKLQIHFSVWSHHSEKQEGQPLWCRFSSTKSHHRMPYSDWRSFASKWLPGPLWYIMSYLVPVISSILHLVISQKPQR